MMGHLVNVAKVLLRTRNPYAPVFEVFRGGSDVTGQVWYFRERTAGRITSTGGEAYASKWNAKRAAYAHAARVDGSVVRVTPPLMRAGDSEVEE